MGTLFWGERNVDDDDDRPERIKAFEDDCGYGKVPPFADATNDIDDDDDRFEPNLDIDTTLHMEK